MPTAPDTDLVGSRGMAAAWDCSSGSAYQCIEMRRAWDRYPTGMRKRQNSRVFLFEGDASANLDGGIPRPSQNSRARMIVTEPFDDPDEITLVAENDQGYRRFNLDRGSLQPVQNDSEGSAPIRTAWDYSYADGTERRVSGARYTLSFPNHQATFDDWKEKNPSATDTDQLDIEMLKGTYPVFLPSDLEPFVTGAYGHQSIIIKEVGLTRGLRFSLFHDSLRPEAVRSLFS